jgi:hypothetical protein
MNIKNNPQLSIHAFHSCKTYRNLPNETPSLAVNKVLLDNINIPVEWGENHRVLVKKPSLEQVSNKLPSVTNMVWLRSKRTKDSGDFGSELFVIWFSEPEYSQPVSDLVEKIISTLDWNKYAVDFKLDDL